MSIATFILFCDVLFTQDMGVRAARILVAIYEKPEITMSEIACLAAVSHAAITSQIDCLSTKGFVVRTRAAKLDARFSVLTLTPVGEKFVQSIIDAEVPV